MVNSYGSDKDEDHMDVDTVDIKNKLKEEAEAAKGDQWINQAEYFIYPWGKLFKLIVFLIV